MSEYKEKCLKDLTDKLSNLNNLKQYSLQRVVNENSQKLEHVAKVLVLLEDEVVNILRTTIRDFFSKQEEEIEKELLNLNKTIETVFENEVNEINRIIKIVESEETGHERVLGKMVSGIFDKKYDNFASSVELIHVPPSMLNFDKAEIQHIAEDLIESLNVRYPRAIVKKNKEDKLKCFNEQEEKLLEDSKGKKENIIKEEISNKEKSEAFDKKGTENCKVIDEFKTESQLRKKKQLEKQFELSNCEGSCIEKLVKMSFEKRKLMKELE